MHQEAPESRLPTPGGPTERFPTGTGCAGRLLWPWTGSPGQHLAGAAVSERRNRYSEITIGIEGKKATSCSTWLFVIVKFTNLLSWLHFLSQLVILFCFHSDIHEHNHRVWLYSHQHSLSYRSKWLVGDQVSASVFSTGFTMKKLVCLSIKPNIRVCSWSHSFRLDGLIMSSSVLHLSASSTASSVWWTLSASSRLISVMVPSWRWRSQSTSTTCLEINCSGNTVMMTIIWH